MAAIESQQGLHGTKMQYAIYINNSSLIYAREWIAVEMQINRDSVITLSAIRLSLSDAVISSF